MPPVGNDEASGSPWVSSLPENSAIAVPSPCGALIESCFSAVRPVSGWNQWVKCVAPCSIAQSFMAAATASASGPSSPSPVSIARCRRRKMSLGRRWRWTASEKTLAPKTAAPGWVRSTAPSAPPFTLHCAAVTLGWRVRAGMVLLDGSRPKLAARRRADFIPMDKPLAGVFAPWAKPLDQVEKDLGVIFRPPSNVLRPPAADPPGRIPTEEDDSDMQFKRLARAVPLAGIIALAAPAAAFADTFDAKGLPQSVGIN